ncbi:MAG TPA: DUF445 domain-containing protein [Solimonas sp.]|nr:DUF445 domain-containing protein [Solimonas sp.]
MALQSFSEIVVDVQQNWMIYVSMPFVAAAIGYFTKIIAIHMMFEPIEFVGKKPYFGWQGIVPRNAARMAGIAVDTLTQKLLKTEELFGRLDPARVAKEIEKPLMEAVEDITREVAAIYAPGLWQSAPDSVRKALVSRVQSEAPKLIADLMVEVKKNVNKVFDLKHMVVTNLIKDKRLLNRIFRDVGAGEFRFIRNSGLYFGFALGCIQALTWAVTQSPWVMPIFGGLTGWFTDWLALRMVFEPKQPKRYFGLFTWQGLFIKRRKEVASEYGRLIAKEVLTPSAIIEAVLSGPLSDKLFALVQRQVQQVIDEQSGMARPLVVFAFGSTRYTEMKNAVAAKIIERLPETLKHVEQYAADAMDIQNDLGEKMKQLSEEEFEGLLRPAFQQDEWILITVGAVLGALVGELQVQIMLHLGGLH